VLWHAIDTSSAAGCIPREIPDNHKLLDYESHKSVGDRSSRLLRDKKKIVDNSIQGPITCQELNSVVDHIVVSWVGQVLP
jgi:hypothetical protein